MTDQTRWGIDLVHTKNKAIKRQKDIIIRALSEVERLEEQYIVELMMEIEAIYERKYGDNKANKVILQVSVTDLKKYFFSLRKSVLCVHLAVFRWYTRLSGGQGVDTFSVFGVRLGHFIKTSVKTQTARDIDILKTKICGRNIYAQKKKKSIVN